MKDKAPSDPQICELIRQPAELLNLTLAFVIFFPLFDPTLEGYFF